MADREIYFFFSLFLHRLFIGTPRNAGKDRTSMGVTLENTRALVEDVGVLNGQEVRITVIVCLLLD